MAMDVDLRQRLQLLIAEGHHERADKPALRLDLREVCDLARRDGVRVEQLLIMLKKAWRELPETLHAPHRDSEDALARVVTACIDEYYLGNGAYLTLVGSRGLRAADRELPDTTRHFS